MTSPCRLAVVLLVALPALAQKPAKEPAPDQKAKSAALRVQRFYEHAKNFTARFAQTSTYPTFGNVKQASGKVYLMKPDRLRWEYDDGRLIVLDGKALWNWNAEDKEATVHKGFGVSQVPAEFAFLFGKGTLLDRFAVREVPAAQGLPQGETLELVPRKPSGDVQKLVLVTGPDGQVKASVVTNSQGDLNQLVFSEVKVDGPLADSIFRFEPPAGAHVTEVK
jgi:outer membrane lipoprotein carrier protein